MPRDTKKWTCNVCNKILTGYSRLSMHSKQKHGMTREDVAITYLYDGIRPICQSYDKTCSNYTKWDSDDRKFNTYCSTACSRRGNPVGKGRKRPQHEKDKIRTTIIRQYTGNNQITYEEYLKTLPDRIAYYKAVWYYTNTQTINQLENYEKRGRSGVNNAYQLDHIYPISKGYDNNISAEVIGDISNLRMIPWKENRLKSNKIINEISYNVSKHRTSEK